MTSIGLDSAVYWGMTAAAFLAIAVWETRRAARALSVAAELRWRNHALLYLTSVALVAIVYRAGPVMVAVAAQASPYGLLNRAWMPPAARWVLTLLALDLVRYAEHRACHAVALLWRLHQVHHADPDVDVSTGLRVHPLELLLTQGAYLAAVAVLAPPVGAVLAAEATSVMQTFFSHANARLPEPVERWVRRIWITPDLHRIHHSERQAEEQRNFGDVFPWWDRLLGTYAAAPEAGQEAMVLGLRGMQNPASLRMGFMLRLPFARDAAPIPGYQSDQSR